MQTSLLSLKLVGILPFKRQPPKMVNRTQTIRWQQPTNCLSGFGYFVGLAFKRLIVTSKHSCCPTLVTAVPLDMEFPLFSESYDFTIMTGSVPFMLVKPSLLILTYAYSYLSSSLTSKSSNYSP